jgi:hypothetical protein
MGGLIGPGAFVLGWSVLGTRTPGYSAVDDAISRLAAVGASGRPAMTGAFVVYGLGLLADAAALRSTVPGRAWVAAMATGAATLGVAAAPLDSSVALDRAHAALAGFGYLAVASVPALAAGPLRRAGHRRWAASAAASAAVATAALLASLAAPHHGLTQRLGLTAADAWIAAWALATMGGATVRRP